MRIAAWRWHQLRGASDHARDQLPDDRRGSRTTGVDQGRLRDGDLSHRPRMRPVPSPNWAWNSGRATSMVIRIAQRRGRLQAHGLTEPSRARGSITRGRLHAAVRTAGRLSSATLPRIEGTSSRSGRAVVRSWREQAAWWGPSPFGTGQSGPRPAARVAPELPASRGQGIDEKRVSPTLLADPPTCCHCPERTDLSLTSSHDQT